MRDPINQENLLIMGERKVHIFDLKKMEFISALDDEECFLRRAQSCHFNDDDFRLDSHSEPQH
jgi:hypothetical protein